jgi:hypothetical protein
VVWQLDYVKYVQHMGTDKLMEIMFERNAYMLVYTYGKRKWTVQYYRIAVRKRKQTSKVRSGRTELLISTSMNPDAGVQATGLTLLKQSDVNR